MRYNKIQNQYQRSDISAAIRRCWFVGNFLQCCVNFCVRQRVKFFILLALFAAPARPQNAPPRTRHHRPPFFPGSTSLEIGEARGVDCKRSGSSTATLFVGNHESSKGGRFMSLVLNFTANWNKWYRVLRYRKGFGLFDSVRFGLWLARS
jgi:hypothetical protein